MNRRLTNFPSQLPEALMECFESSNLQNILRYYQILTACYIKLGVSKGLYLWHHMGMGKTLGAYHIMYEVMAASGYKKSLVIAPRALVSNFKQSADKYEELTKNKLDRNNIHFVKLSHTVEKQISLLDPDGEIDPFNMEKKVKRIEKLKNLNGFIVFIEEAHLFSRKISHGSDAMIRLYELIMQSDCKVVMLSGSLIAASPFELAPILNMLSGEYLYPEIEEDFNEAFVDFDEMKIKNKFHFQDRAYGLISRMKPEYLGEVDKSMYPEVLPEVKADIPMGVNQYNNYLRVREKEIKEEKAKKLDIGKRSHNKQKFKASESVMGSFRVRSRQYCNFAPTAPIEKYYKEGSYDQETLIKEVKKMDRKESSSSKAEFFLNRVYPSHLKRKGVVYSQFVGVCGAASIAHFLRIRGWRELDANLQLGDYHEKATKEEKESGAIFAQINGSLSEEEQARLVDYYCKKDNDDGHLLTIILIGIEQCMGLDLTSVGYIVMFEPYWVYFLKDQLEHRGNRYKSHLTLPENQRNVIMYIFCADYPKTVKPEDFEEAGLKKTTDHHVYEKMIRNKKLIGSFKEALEEISVECELINKFNPKSNHTCRTCIPSNRPLYTSDSKNPKKAFELDLEVPTPCESGDKENITVEEIVITDSQGEKTKYYYTSADNLYGYIIYFEVSPDNFEEVPINSPVYKEIIEAIKSKKK